ncbi:unnamed protein product [Dovyalis caffra]|nr:unnamed protein product [Dovyalis caffra]
MSFSTCNITGKTRSTGRQAQSHSSIAADSRTGIEAFEERSYKVKIGSHLNETKRRSDSALIFLPLTIKKRGNIARKGSILLIPPLYATIARGGIPLTEISFSHPSQSLPTGERGSLLWPKITCHKLHYDRTFPLDACPPNFTPVEDPTFSSFSHGAFSDLILGFPLGFDLTAPSQKGIRGQLSRRNKRS